MATVTLNGDNTYSASPTYTDETYNTSGSATLAAPAGAWTFPSAAWTEAFSAVGIVGCTPPPPSPYWFEIDDTGAISASNHQTAIDIIVAADTNIRTTIGIAVTAEDYAASGLAADSDIELVYGSAPIGGGENISISPTLSSGYSDIATPFSVDWLSSSITWDVGGTFGVGGGYVGVNSPTELPSTGNVLRVYYLVTAVGI